MLFPSLTGNSPLISINKNPKCDNDFYLSSSSDERYEWKMERGSFVYKSENCPNVEKWCHAFERFCQAADHYC